jgi:hypothetical protein
MGSLKNCQIRYISVFQFFRLPIEIGSVVLSTLEGWLKPVIEGIIEGASSAKSADDSSSVIRRASYK